MKKENSKEKDCIFFKELPNYLYYLAKLGLALLGCCSYRDHYVCTFASHCRPRHCI